MDKPQLQACITFNTVMKWNALKMTENLPRFAVPDNMKHCWLHSLYIPTFWVIPRKGDLKSCPKARQIFQIHLQDDCSKGLFDQCDGLFSAMMDRSPHMALLKANEIKQRS